VPVLFLQLRSEPSFEGQVARLELPLRLIWLVLLEVLLLYCVFDQWLIGWLFGAGFEAALLPTRLLLLTALLECLAQLVVQPILGTGQTRIYGFSQNSSALLAALLGWLWIPNAGLSAYLLVRLLYVLLPLSVFVVIVFKQLKNPSKLYQYALTTIALAIFLSMQILDIVPHSLSLAMVYAVASLIVLSELFRLKRVFFSIMARA